MAERPTPRKKLPLPKGDDGKNLAIPLTPEQAKAGLEALDALMMHPDIHPDTPFVDALAILKEQLPVIDTKAEVLESRKSRTLAIRSTIKKSASALAIVGTIAWGGNSCFNANYSPAAYEIWEANHTLGGSDRSTVSSTSQWSAHLADDPKSYTEKDPEAKPRILNEQELVIVNNQNTKIIIRGYQLVDKRVVPEFIVNNLRAILPAVGSNQPNGQFVVFENPVRGEEAAVAIKVLPTTPPVFEVRDLKKLPAAR